MKNENMMGFTINSGSYAWGYPYVGDLPDDYPWPTAPLQQGIPSSVTWTISERVSELPKREDYALAELGHFKGEPRVILGIVSRETLDAVAKFSVLRSDMKKSFIEWRYDMRIFDYGSQVAFHPGWVLVMRFDSGFKVVHDGGKEHFYDDHHTYGAGV